MQNINESKAESPAVDQPKQTSELPKKVEELIKDQIQNFRAIATGIESPINT